MKKLFLLLFFCYCSSLLAQSVPVTFHFRPANKNFTALRLVGTMNGWNNADDAMKMSDVDNDGEYTITVPLTAGTDYAYKFCMNADWGLAYGDPDNPRINTSDNDNSMLLVNDPMISYLLPRDKDSKNKVYVDTSKYGNPIRVIIAYSTDKPIDPSALIVKIDGTALNNPAQYYNSTSKEFIYLPNPPLSVGDHTVNVSISSPAGTDTKTATFSRDPNQKVYKVPVDFYYDQNNKSVVFAQTLTDVAVVGSFNNWNDSFNPMNNISGNGVWETTVMLEPDTIEYKIKLNKISWENDPDYSTINSVSGNNRFVVVADTISSLKLLYPMENQAFRKDTTVKFKILLRPGATSKGVDTGSIVMLYDGSPSVHAYQSDGTVNAEIALSGAGRHTVECTFKNKEGISAHQIFSFGITTASKGVYTVDGIGDEQYSYPTGVTAGSADILSVVVQETTLHDSLKFIIQMKTIDERTRIGLLISNSVVGFVNDPRQLDIKLPDWNGQGVFASIGVPGNSVQNLLVENRFMTANNPVTYHTDSIAVNGDAITTKKFEFTVSLAFLGRFMGGWTQERQFSLFSYLASTDKSGNGYEVTVAEGGNAAVEDPDIYDAAFIRSSFWQNRILKNYSPSNSRLVLLDGTGRGLLPVTADQISDSLASKETYVSFYTPGVEYWYSNVTVRGSVTDTLLKKISFVFNGTATDYNITNGKFDISVVLKEGKNSIFVKIVDTNNVTTTSKELVLTYTPDKKPIIQLTGTVNGRKISLNATATSPIGEQLNYTWESDANNPAAVSIPSTTNSADITLPSTDGEYIFSAHASDTKSNSAFAKITVKAVGDSIYLASADDNYHAAWIDSAVIYEIFPRSFSQQGGFQGITANIGRLKSLGVNTVWFMPVFDGPTVHGYETSNYYAFESDYGTSIDFVNMISALKQNGIRIILDLVINHTGVTHPFMQNVFKHKGYSPWADFYLWSGEPGASSYQYFFDWSSLPNLNYKNPDVKKYFIDVSKYWVQQYGIDGYRCDVAWGVEQRNNVFWNEWRKGIKSVNPNVYLLAEASSSDSSFYQKKFDSAYDWDLRSLMISVLNGSNTLGNVHKQVMRSYPNFGRPFRFVENHDETRAVSMFDSKRSLLMHTIVFTLNGIPLIYSGGEVGEATQRNIINWTDPNMLQPYFARLVKIRKDYIYNPVINRIINSDTAAVYSYSSVSGNKTLLTVANFKNTSPTVTLDVTSMPYDGKSTYYLTDMFTGVVYTIVPADRKAVSVTLTNYQARVFYYGLNSIPVSVLTENPVNIPNNMVLEQNFPNPFNPATTLRYGLTENSRVKIQIFNVLGQVVTELVNGEQTAGWHDATWTASVSSGIYFYRIEATSTGDPGKRFVQVKKMMLMK